ncbi:MAG: sigma-70 family RNA polymerase sigma factor [Bacteroidota bacterium]
MSLEAFKSRVLPTKNKLYRFALQIVKDDEEAKDIVQEVFIKVWNGKQEIEDLENTEAWCMRLTRNLCYDRVKSKRFKTTDSLEPSMSIQGGEVPDKTMEMSDTMKSIDRFIHSLPEKQQQVMRLRDIEGYSYKEIGKMLEIDMSQVKVNLFRARKAVRENLVNINAYGL